MSEQDPSAVPDREESAPLPPPPPPPPPLPAPAVAPSFPSSPATGAPSSPMGVPGPYPGAPPSGKRVGAGVCGILLGAFGVHKFILGYTTAAVVMLLVSIIGGILTCGVATIVMSTIGLIEGIMYLTKSDAEFDATYVYAKREWF